MTIINCPIALVVISYTKNFKDFEKGRQMIFATFQKTANFHSLLRITRFFFAKYELEFSIVKVIQSF